MSLQNLLEMDDFSNHSAGKELPPVPGKRVPKPVPRSSRVPRLKGLSKTHMSRERAIDEVESISSTDGISPKPPKRSVAFTTTLTSSFDNNAFTMDEMSGADEDKQAASPSEQRPPTRRKPKPLERGGKINSSEDASSSWFATEQENRSIRKTDTNNKTVMIGEESDNNNDDHSSATFTIENEKSNDKDNMAKKPPIPKPKRKPGKGSQRIPANESISFVHSDKDNLTSASGSPESIKSKRLEMQVGYSTIEIEPEASNIKTNGNHDKNSCNEVDKRDEKCETESAEPEPTQQIVKKSRFGKLFSTSSDSKKQKSSSTTDRIVDDEMSSAGTSGKIGDDKHSIVTRWKKTFAKSLSKHASHQEKGDNEEAEPATQSEQGDKDKEKVKDTRIFMPENSDDESGSDEETSKQVVVNDDERKSREEMESAANQGTGALEGKQEKENEMGKEKRKLKQFAKLTIGKGKDKSSHEDIKMKGKKQEGKSANVAKRKSEFEERKEKKVHAEKERQERRHQRAVDEFSQSQTSSSEDDRRDESPSPTQLKAKRSPLKRMLKSGPKQRDIIVPCVDTASGKDLLFGVTIHSSDLLPLDPNVIHPVVKVTVMFQSGEYMRRSDNKRDNTSRIGGGGRDDETKGSEKRTKRNRKLKNGDDNFSRTSNPADSVFPIMSQPCRARHSIPTFAPTWNELLVFEEPFKRFALPNEKEVKEDPEPILFFEIMDFLPMSSGNGNSVATASSSTGFHGSEAGWYKIAWAFLKPVGGNGNMNLNRKLRLQLYKPVKLSKKEMLAGPEVFSWWKSGRREKINNCTLYVTPKGINPPETRSASLKQLLSMRKEHLTQAILDSQLATTADRKKKKQQSLTELQNYTSWTRMEGQSCKPPNKLVASLPCSQIESLNIVISGNVYCTKFSPCGNILAAGLDTDELHVILLFKVPSWTLCKTLKGHHGIIYDIAWTIVQLDEEDENLLSCHYLASSSADSTVRIWRMINQDATTVSLFKVLYHPSYVYSVKFHPTHPDFVVTGCFDFVIRIWNLGVNSDGIRDSKMKKKKGTIEYNTDVSPIILLDKHSSFVNCLLFDPTGSHLFSGDGVACIFKWSCVSPSRKKSWRLEKDVKVHSGNVPVNCLDLHPSGTRILVHLRDNFLKILDVVTLIPLQSFSGLRNERLQIRSCFTPCGNLVLSGSEDGTLCIWDGDTGKILQLTSPENHPHCVVSCVDYHPFDYYVAVGLSSAISEPSPVLIYFFQQSQNSSTGITYPVLMKRTAMRMRQNFEKSRSQSSMKSFATTFDDDTQLQSHKMPPKRGDSTEKFISIIHKLDTALYFAQQRNKKRQTEAQSSACLSESQSPSSNLQQQKPTYMVKEEITKTVESGNGNRQYMKKKQTLERPRSASLASARAKRERFRKSTDETPREAKSDSEQAYQEKVIIRNQSGNQQCRPPKKYVRRMSIPTQEQQESIDDENNIIEKNNNIMVISQ